MPPRGSSNSMFHRDAHGNGPCRHLLQWPREQSIGFPNLGDCVRRDTSRHPYTHIIESREVRYPWHPWYCQRAWIYARFVKYGVASFRCGIGERVGDRSTHLPQWMFDAVACCDLRLTPTPVVSCEALVALKMLLACRLNPPAAVTFVEARHPDPSSVGDADAKLAENHTICALSPAASVSKLGRPAPADQTAADSTSRPIDARASRKGNRQGTPEGGRS
jgi:hypothetical protein